jgi:hypothetical protein
MTTASTFKYLVRIVEPSAFSNVVEIKNKADDCPSAKCPWGQIVHPALRPRYNSRKMVRQKQAASRASIRADM